ncbi:Arc family DNA-binding protein [Sinorhizobium americanum]|uniref:Arc-like DNA binding dprotein n=1 Tax=Sinorhizobium americanum TaxID=194963 RepID=A0A4R2BS46_9HYPH|nr:Arc family DNA-binding protein [Sinorhizobium americanum]TCN30306.1 Arc-like DNA binding dprotein [Sinorhizobium americanum]
MAREDLHFRLRIPEGLKNRIEDAAAENNRSMTAEIIDRLETSFAPLPPEMKAMIAEFTHQLILAFGERKAEDS